MSGEREKGERSAGEKLFQRECQFVAGAAAIDQLPPMGPIEVAFAGRSNVGKSSLLNALTGRKALARVSQNPGRTQQLNFFDLNGELVLVDMPGHGYAKVSKKTSGHWSRLIEAYLKGRANLRRLLLLIDSRHGFKDSDTELMDMLDQVAISYQVVMTKADTLAPGELDVNHAKFLGQIRRRPAAHPEIVITSSEEGRGINDLRDSLAALAAQG